jgi:hypothetical protein
MISCDRDLKAALDRYIMREQDSIACPNLRALDFARQNELTSCICILDCLECQEQCCEIDVDKLFLVTNN